jgi:hypothetical protein
MPGRAAIALTGVIAFAIVISLSAACTSILGIEELRSDEGTYGVADAGGGDADGGIPDAPDGGVDGTDDGVGAVDGASDASGGGVD